jgi:tetratricopeptide (TPR) repeat protein
LEKAVRAYQDCLEVQEGIALSDAARTQFRQDMIPTHLFLGRVLLRLGRAEVARKHIQTALQLSEAQRGISPNNLYTIRNLSDCYEAMGQLEAGGGWREKNARLWEWWESTHGASSYSRERRRKAGA